MFKVFMAVSYVAGAGAPFRIAGLTAGQRLLLTESWIARRNNTPWIPTFRF